MPPETVDFLDEIRRENDVHKRTVVSSFGTDPELDEFMVSLTILLPSANPNLTFLFLKTFYVFVLTVCSFV